MTAGTVFVPGRVNLIGEHIDYHGLPVLPMAVRRGIRIEYRRREDRRVVASSESQPLPCDFEWTPQLVPGASGDWGNYVKAAAQAVSRKWGVLQGIDAAIRSDLPAAAGLSSSSALLTAVTLALLRANGVHVSFGELMEILPEGEYFVGTRGGGMDHAAVLGGREGCAVLVRFLPTANAEPVSIPRGWTFLIAHSLTVAEKSGALREEYNARRTAGTAALANLGLRSYEEAIRREVDTASLPDGQRRAFLHVAGEGRRVIAAVEAMRSSDAAAFGELLFASHGSLRDLLRVSSPALDALVEAARESGALGARLTGAGFGGCAIVFCRETERDRVRDGLIERFYAGKPEFDRAAHLLEAQPSDGALYA